MNREFNEGSQAGLDALRLAVSRARKGAVISAVGLELAFGLKAHVAQASIGEVVGSPFFRASMHDVDVRTEAAPDGALRNVAADPLFPEALPPLESEAPQPIAENPDVIAEPAEPHSVPVELEPPILPPPEPPRHYVLPGWPAVGRGSEAWDQGFTGSNWYAAPANLAESGSLTYGAEQLGRFSEEQARLGRHWSLHLGVDFSAVYDDNVLIEGETQRGDLILTESATVALGIGSPESSLYVLGEYTVGMVSYVDGNGSNSVDQAAGLIVRYRFPKLVLGFRSSYRSGWIVTRDLGERTRAQILTSELTATYPFSEKLSMELDLSGALGEYSNAFATREGRGFLFLDYQLTPKVRIGVGGDYGVSETEASPSERTAEALARIQYRVTERLSVEAFAGPSFRYSAGSREHSDVVWGLSAVYVPRPKTTFELSAHRSVLSSAALREQSYTTTGIVGTVRQGLWSGFAVGVAAGWENAEYFAVAQGVNANRKDNYFFVRPTADYDLRSWCHVSAFYEFSDNESRGFGSRSFSRNRVGLQVSILF